MIYMANGLPIRFDILNLLEEWKAGTRRYFPGSFMTAVLSNDLAGAVTRADPYNLSTIIAIMLYCVNELPPESWGSSEKVKAWVEKARAG